METTASEEQRQTARDALLFRPDAEAAYLGLLLLTPEHFVALAGQIRSDDFTRGQHQAVYAAMRAVAAGGRVPDIVLVMEELQARGADQHEVSAIIGLVVEAPTPARVRDYALAIREAAMRRRLLQLGQHLAQAAYQPAAPAPHGLQQILDRARRWLDAIEARLAEPVAGLHPGEDWEVRTPPPPVDPRWQGIEIPL